MGISNLKDGVAFTGIMLTCWKINGNQPTFWKKCNLKPTRKEKLFNSDHMEFFTNAFANNLVNNGPLNFVQVMAAIRQKYINDWLDKLCETNVNQVVILGAGFDIRASSSNHSKITFFEIDFEEVQQIKRTIYKENNIEPNAKYISTDYLENNLIHSLKEANVNPDIPTLFIFEGNSMYNSKESINKLFNQINQNFKDYYVVMDYVSEKFINKRTGITENDLAVQNNSKLNAHLINGYDNIEGFICPNNLKLLENVSSGLLAYKYGIHDGPWIPQLNDHFILFASNIKEGSLE